MISVDKLQARSVTFSCPALADGVACVEAATNRARSCRDRHYCPQGKDPDVLRLAVQISSLNGEAVSDDMEVLFKTPRPALHEKLAITRILDDHRLYTISSYANTTRRLFSDMTKPP
jgi:hypothetical protein